ncbi:MAG TPA: RNA methyltransferase [Thermoanaerobaculia bacterium]|nr:RNA methyltransferase [Thermoanaerobaculia bacterium]
MLLYGFHPVREALRHRPHQVVRVLVAGGRGGRRRDEVEELCRRHRVALEALPERALAALAGPAHNGFAAEVREGAGEVAGADPDLLVLVEDVQDPRNLGALLRVCEGAGVGRVLVRDRGSAPLTPAVVKTAAGAAEWLAVERIVNPAQSLEALKAQGFWVYGAAEGGEAPWNVDLTGKVVLCMGGEEKGLRARTRQLCDRLIGLPMRGRVESLNLATAAAALLYEAVRQRAVAGGEGRG